MVGRERDGAGRPQQARARDGLGRPLPRGSRGADPLPDPLPTEAAAAVALAQDLLDCGLPFQAHEVLEEVWRTCPPDQRTAWQGLAQLAVAITHDRRGNPRGARLLLAKAAGHLCHPDAELPEDVDVAGVRDWLARARQSSAAGRQLPDGLRLYRADG